MLVTIKSNVLQFKDILHALVDFDPLIGLKCTSNFKITFIVFEMHGFMEN